jgi:D-glycero-D-manno-heptose 1,7-bisphosphate phosphatase
LVENVGGKPPNKLAEQKLIEGVKTKTKALKESGHVLAVASNQGGVAFGYLTEKDAKQLVKDAAEKIGASAYLMCPYHPEGTIGEYVKDSVLRKPNPGMLQLLMIKFRHTSHQTIYVGDRPEDEKAAKNAGVRFIEASEFWDTGWRDLIG